MVPNRNVANARHDTELARALISFRLFGLLRVLHSGLSWIVFVRVAVCCQGMRFAFRISCSLSKQVLSVDTLLPQLKHDMPVGINVYYAVPDKVSVCHLIQVFLLFSLFGFTSMFVSIQRDSSRAQWMYPI